MTERHGPGPIFEMPKDPPGVPEGLHGTLTATPASIKAGETVYVSWSAAAPFSGFQFKVNGLDVPLRGKHEYRPLDTQTYTLTATRGTSTIHLATSTVTVDRSACTLEGGLIAQSGAKQLIGLGFFRVLGKAAGYQVSKGRFTVRLWLNAASDVGVEFQADSGLIKLVVPLRISLDGVPGEGTATITAWFSLSVVAGVVVPINTRTETDLSPPWGYWLPALAGGVEVAVLLAILNGIAPGVLSSSASEPLEGIAPLFAALGNRVVSVRIVADEFDPFVMTIICP